MAPGTCVALNDDEDGDDQTTINQLTLTNQPTKSELKT
jgi:hypothetical protein